MVAGAIQVVEPFGKVDIHVRFLFITLPQRFPWLIGLVFASDKAPVVAADLFQIEQREHLLHGVVQAARQPFGVDDGAAVGLLQPLDILNIGLVSAMLLRFRSFAQ